MPELPDITVYIEALARRVRGRTLQKVRLLSPFLLRTALPPIDALEERKVVALRRLGKRIVFGFAGDQWLVLHLMIAGRLHWTDTSPAAGAGATAKQPKPGAMSSRRSPSIPACSR